MEYITKSKESFLAQDILGKGLQSQTIFYRKNMYKERKKTLSLCPTW